MPKTKPKPKTAAKSNRRAAIRALEGTAAREAVGAFYAVARTLVASAEMKSLLRANAGVRSHTVSQIVRQAFRYATSGVPSKRKIIRESAVPPFPHYLRLPPN
jgi:hypothetical protein